MYAQFVQAPMPQQQQQLQQQQQYMPFGPGIGGGVDYGGHRPSPSGASLKRVLHGPLEDKPLVSLIITICGGSSYDDLFRSIPQLAPSGRVSVFSAKPSYDDLFRYCKSEPSCSFLHFSPTVLACPL
eukprot:TRINITY_DN2740_c0_g1_i1.p1 TRINITY_DN2740_c0_g1~~TRINITY_DN2740_c0_g1_i1.p1  ORF type:complete len:127 (+),score=17.09 TRINITY_DN2740_c0_g1_i1:51-431(+)